MELLVKLTARFLEKNSGQPISGNEYLVKLFDKDFFADDFLGEAIPDLNGIIDIIFNPKLAKSADSPFETEPDLYCVVFKNAEVIFKSIILEDISFSNVADFNVKEGLHYDMGTFII